MLKAQEFARAYEYDNSEKLDINWVNRWKTREEVVCKKLHGEAESVDQDGVNKWQNYRLPTLLKEFQLEHSTQMKQDFFIGVCLTRCTFLKMKNAQVVNCPKKD